ncbi:stress-induced protein [Pseudomonas sp. PSKL.D1]|uniref:stress-induced protein n=1 Tax=Pseudomonas sp. PSKL.D1 TaxID=3029060 RepID=UPI002380CC10|nr:stress-induced protein [Pseudomonas sp. PSKL.D1]WDY55817.1 stress-induced protein [Pseudomonas sp. PSKL.D1]
MANEQDKHGQQGGQMSGGRPEEQPQGGQGSWQDRQGNDPERARGANEQGAKGGHSTGQKSDTDRQNQVEDDSENIQDDDSDMTDNNR